ncbi:MAG: flagellar export protein FliJ [Dehalococcoidia bacterium]|nr:flagellar export protein FliJ [Dehalococcoidia bacterium]
MTAQGFRLGQVLEHKRRIEEQRQLELQRVVAEQERLDIELRELQHRLDTQITDYSQRSGLNTVDAADLEAASRFAARLQSLIEQQYALIEAATAEVAERRSALMVALQERRSLELLQERQEAAARVEEQRREERVVDELNTARFGLGQGA